MDGDPVGEQVDLTYPSLYHFLFTKKVDQLQRSRLPA